MVANKTRLEIRTEVADVLGDLAATIWSASELSGYVKEGYSRFCLDTEVLWRRLALGDVAGTFLYTIPTEAYQLERVEWNDYRITPLYPYELQSQYPAFESITGPAKGYMMEGDGLRVLRRVPGAAVTDSTELVIEYSRRGTALSGDADAVEVPDWCAIIVRFYALWRALSRDGDGQNLKLANHFKTRYDEGIRRLVQRKSRAATATRTGVLGEAAPPSGMPPRPQLPWNFGPIVK